MSCIAQARQKARDLLRQRLARFLAVGLLNTAFGYVVFYLVLSITKHAIAAALFATLAGVLFNFRSLGALVFDSHDKSLLTRFVMVYAAIFAVNVAGLRLFETLGVDAAFAQVCLLPLLAGLSYVLNRDHVFSRSSAPGPSS